jgi:hypothetical protein
VIVIFAEYWPNGQQDQAVPLGSLGLHDQTQPGDLLGTFVYEIDEAPQPNLNVDQLSRAGTVIGVNRKQSVWKIVKKTLETVFPNIVT